MEKNDEIVEMGVVAQGITKAASLLATKYSWVVTNVPFKNKGELSEDLQKYLSKNHNKAQSALETAFMERCLNFAEKRGVVCIVLPQNWLFLKSYDSFREELLKNFKWHLLAWLGEKAFQTPLGVAPILLSMENSRQKANFFGYNVAKAIDFEAKGNLLKVATGKTLNPSSQLQNPDTRITYSESLGGDLLSKNADSAHGQGSFDSPRFSFYFWEVNNYGTIWEYQQSSPSKTQEFDGCSYIFRWEQGKGALWEYMHAKKEEEGYTSGKWKAGVNLWGIKGVLIRQMGNLPAALYLGHAFDDDTAAIVPHQAELLPAIWCYCSSDVYIEEVRKIDQKRNVTNSTLAKVPFDLNYWTNVAQEKYPNGLPQPYSDDPTQWIFYGHPAKSDAPLQVAVARLLGYR